MSSRYRKELDAQTAVDLDPGFTGVNAKIEPSLLRTGHAFYEINQQIAGPGILSQAKNCRFKAGTVTTRPGSLQPNCYNPSGIGTIVGSGVFSDPNGLQWLLLATSTGVYQLSDSTTPTRIIGLPAATTLTAPVRIVQSFNTVLLFRGSGVGADDEAAPLQWDGEIGSDFVVIPQTDSGTFLETIPNSADAVVFGGRLYCAASRDQVAVSDVLDYTRWDSILSSFRFNSGEDDSIVGLHPYRRNNLLVFKEQSIYVLANTYGDLSDIRAELINADLGLAAARSIATVGSDIYFLAHGGVYRLSEIVENSMSTQEVPVSDPIQPFIDRINPAAIAGAVAVVHDLYYKLAVPLDDSTTNNAILVFDTTTGQWQGTDEYPSDFNAFHEVDWLDRKTIAAIDYANGTVTMLDTGGPSDLTPSTETQITSQVTTRGYVLGDAGIKRFQSVLFALETFNPSLKFEAITEGQNEIRILKDTVTRSRLNYSIWDKADYNPTNVNDDHADPRREDYSVDLADGDLDMGAAGVDLFLKQSWLAPFLIRQTGRWIAFRVTCTNGSFTLKTVQADSARKPSQMRIAI